MFFGAAIGAAVKNPFGAVFLALLGHYFIDIFPHIEYSINNIQNKNWRKSLLDFLKVLSDFLLGLLFIYLLSENQPIIYLCTLISLVPDGLTLLSKIFPNKILERHDKIHTETIHYLTKQKKFSLIWRIATQAAVFIISIIILLQH
jgi:hypothetical protein